MLPDVNILITKFPLRSSWGGAEDYTVQIVKNLSGQGCRFFLLSSCASMLSEFRKQGWQNTRWWLGFSPENFFSKLIFPITLLIAICPAIVILMYFRFWRQARKLYCCGLADKIILTPFAYLMGYRIIWVELLSVEKTVLHNCFGVVYKLISPLVKIISISNFVKGQLRKKGIYGVKVIYPGLDCRHVLRKVETKEKKRFDPQKLTICTCCHITKDKRIEDLLKSLKILRNIGVAAELEIIGGGRHLSRVIDVARCRGLHPYINFVGYDREALERIFTCDIYVLPSIAESFGVSLLVPMLLEKPIVAVKSGGVVEIINNEKEGLLVESKNPEELAGAVIRFLNNKKFTRRIVSSAKRKVLRRFTLEIMLEEWRKELVR
jgi:glycosyltransferase involved in cell wall biosynthesis